jgi:hypothetical protein
MLTVYHINENIPYPLTFDALPPVPNDAKERIPIKRIANAMHKETITIVLCIFALRIRIPTALAVIETEIINNSPLANKSKRRIGFALPNEVRRLQRRVPEPTRTSKVAHKASIRIDFDRRLRVVATGTCWAMPGKLIGLDIKKSFFLLSKERLIDRAILSLSVYPTIQVV